MVTQFETREADWLPVDEALERILTAARPLSTERVALSEALGRALAAPLGARARLPPWDNSAMDGYAVIATDVESADHDHPVKLGVVGEVRAGARPPQVLGPGEAVRIMTGGPVPLGADSVVRVEDTDREEAEPGSVWIRSSRDARKNVRPGGQDMEAGDIVLGAGTSLGPGQTAVAAAAGYARVEVGRRPRVAILSSGDELRTPERFDDVIRAEGLPETNGLTLHAASLEAGAAPLPPALALDDPQDLREHVGRAMDADVLLTSGGASMGEADLFKRVLDEMGFELVFWRVRLRPGSPLSFGWLPRPPLPPLPVFGLPGNPASAFVTFELFVRPFLLRLAGHHAVHRRVAAAQAGERLPSSEGLTHVHRIVLSVEESAMVARLTGPQGSGMVSSLGAAHGLAVVPPGKGGIPVGAGVQVILLDRPAGGTETPGYNIGSK